MNSKEAYKILQMECGIKVGDKVRVLRTAEEDECGWQTVWDVRMDDSVGEVLEVRGFEEPEFGPFLSDGFFYPWFVLEKVEEATPREMTVKQISQELGYEVKIVKEK